MKLKKYFAFTLPEVLITMVIIGVIAAITIPDIIANYRRQEASAKIKKAYSMLCQASIRAKVDGKNWEYWAEDTNSVTDADAGLTDTGKNFAQDYLLPYLVYYKTKQSGIYYYIYLNDGTYFWVAKGSCIDLLFDINGEKKPNVEGRDKFRFLYCPESDTRWIASAKVIPYQPKTMKTREQVLNYCKNVSGMYCTALLAIDGWEFKEDYPYSI